MRLTKDAQPGQLSKIRAEMRRIEALLAGPEPELESIGAVEALDELRIDART